MKAAYIILLLIFSAFSSNTTSDRRLVGKWGLVEFALVGQGGNPVSDKKTLDNAGAVWNMNFSKDGDFMQRFNMRKQNMEMEMEEGTWQTKDDSLLIELQMDEVTSHLNYTYKFKGDTLVLTLAPKQSKGKIITKFVKKY